jgi:hypothetical protein
MKNRQGERHTTRQPSELLLSVAVLARVMAAFLMAIHPPQILYLSCPHLLLLAYSLTIKVRLIKGYLAGTGCNTSELYHLKSYSRHSRIRLSRLSF